jgi:hypothetical protein
MADDPIPPSPSFETLLQETAARLRPVFPELSDRVFHEVVARIVAVKLQMRRGAPADEPPPRPPPKPRQGSGAFRNRR